MIDAAERQSWDQLLERLEDQGEKMYGAMLGNNQVTMDVPRQGAAQMYRANWDGCRDIWKASYRQWKEWRSKGAL
jgi:hypothetical protein